MPSETSIQPSRVSIWPLAGFEEEISTEVSIYFEPRETLYKILSGGAERAKQESVTLAS